MIIVEGMDNTGKTILVHKLVSILPLKKYKSPGPDIGEDKQIEWVKDNLEKEDEWVIYDRFPLISEPIYGGIIRGSHNFEDPSKQYLYDVFKKKNPLIIYCRPPRDKVLSFEDGRAQMDGVKTKGSTLLNAYDKIITDLNDEGIKVVGYDYTYDLLERVYSEVCKYLGIEEEK